MLSLLGILTPYRCASSGNMPKTVASSFVNIGTGKMKYAAKRHDKHADLPVQKTTLPAARVLCAVKADVCVYNIDCRH